MPNCRCCKNEVHAQIDYPRRGVGQVESLIGVDVHKNEDRVILHAMLDEWLDQGRAALDGPDHFIVYRKWPVS